MISPFSWSLLPPHCSFFLSNRDDLARLAACPATPAPTPRSLQPFLVTSLVLPCPRTGAWLIVNGKRALAN